MGIDKCSVMLYDGCMQWRRRKEEMIAVCGRRESRCDWPASHTNKEIAMFRELKVSRVVAG